MAYKIVYGEDRQYPKDLVSSGLHFQLLTAAFLLAFLLGVRYLWPEGAQQLREHLLPAGESASQTAFEDLADNLSAGESFGEAISVFCREIIDDAQQESEALD